MPLSALLGREESVVAVELPVEELLLVNKVDKVGIQKFISKGLFLKKVQKVQTLWVASIFFFLELVSG
jgi:hypothetical protein